MLSVIIPTFNEESQIKVTIQKLWKHDVRHLIKEIIVVDGGSDDKTLTIAESKGVKAVVCPQKGRAAQMNYGASLAIGNILYFIHADTIPPVDFTREIVKMVNHGFAAGCYRLAFDYPHWFLKTNCWFTRFNVNAFRFGDQSLFVTKEKFLAVGGFCEKHLVMEDQHIIKKLRRVGSFKVLSKPVLTSARKYLENGIYRTQGIFFLIYLMYHLGLTQQQLVSTYRWLIKQDKL